jgi:hypothetical protein
MNLSLALQQTAAIPTYDATILFIDCGGHVRRRLQQRDPNGR